MPDALGADRELEEVLAIAREASAIVSEVYASPFVVEMKSPGDPVTRADREANDLICRRLAASFPGDAVIAEESAPEDPESLAALLAHERVFFVDPLDGTREFAARNGEFAVMIGLSVAGRPVLGVIVMPTTGDALCARVGGAHFLEGGSGARAPLMVSTLDDPAEARVMVSRSRPPKILRKVQAELGMTRLVPCGSVGAKVAQVARGDAELYMHGGGGAQRWDTCGPEAIVLGAGGRFTDLDGAPIDYLAMDLTIRTGIVAASAPLHERVVAIARRERGLAPL